MNEGHSFISLGGYVVRKFLVLFALILNFQVVMAEDNLQLEKKVEAIMDRSGIEKQTLQLKDTMSGQFKEGVKANKKLTAEQIEKLHFIAMEEFKPQEMVAGIKNRLIKNWSPKEINELHAYYEQDSVKKFSRLEEEGTSLASQAAFMEYATNLEKNPPEKERLGLIINFMNEAKFVDKNTKIIADIVEGMGIAFGEKVPESTLNVVKQQLTPVIQQQLLLSFLFIYRDISNEELKNYFSKYQTDSNLKKLSNDLIEEYNKGFSLWGLNLGTRIKKEFPKADKK